MDPILFYYDSDHLPHFLMVDKVINGVQWQMIGGGGMIDPGENPFEVGYRELLEECFGKEPNEDLRRAAYNGRIVYTGPIVSGRNTSNRWMTTIAIAIQITEELAKTMPLVSDVTEDATRPHWVTPDKMTRVNPIHLPLLNLAINKNVRYVQFPSPFWGRTQLTRFRTVMNNMKKDCDVSVDTDWALADFDEDVYFLAGPCGFDRARFWKQTVDMARTETNKVLIDPINYKLNDENPVYCRRLEKWHILHPKINTVFILPRDQNPKITFDEMSLVVANRKPCHIFVQNGTPDAVVGQIPEPLLGGLIWYESDEEISEWILAK